MKSSKIDRRLFSLGLVMGASSLQAAQTQETSSLAESATVARGTKNACATVSPYATDAAMQVFDRGGNAIDAAVVASLMLSVVDGHNSGIGGGCLAIVRTAAGEVFAIDGREMAPQAASPEMFYTNGKPDPRKSQIGPLASGVPGLLAALHQLSTRFGALNWESSLRAAAERARQGFVISKSYESRLASVVKHIRKFEASAKVLLNDSGKAWRAGETLVQKDLARTLEKVADEGIDWFYGGEFSRRVEQFMSTAGGLMTKADFLKYRAKQRTPILQDYRGHRVVGFPPPSSGGIHNAQMLAMLEQFDVKAVFAESEAKGRHLLAEVMKRAMADRAYWLGDADFAKVPRGLLDKGYLKSRAADIDLELASDVESHGLPPRAELDLFSPGNHTTHLTAADAEGNVVALTQTVNTTFGSKVIIPGTGVVMNNELDDFSIAPGVRNAFGLLGSEANLIAPGKRPLSSMSPTLVLDASGAPVLTCGAAGGPKIITTVLQALVRVLDLGQMVDQAIAAPRAHHQWSPNELVCERAIPDEVVKQLEGFGHKIRRIGTAAVGQGIQFSSRGLIAASDPRVESSAQAG